MARLATLIGHDGEIWFGHCERTDEHRKQSKNEQNYNLLSRFHTAISLLLKSAKLNRFDALLLG
jgi:hypothetical protein